jgi:hypothetical protein
MYEAVLPASIAPGKEPGPYYKDLLHEAGKAKD